MNEEPLIKQEDIDRLIAQDSRWKAVNLAIKVDEELQHSPTVNLILNALQRRSTEAMDGLLKIDPTEAGKIAALQETVNIVKYIGNSLEIIRQEGLQAQANLEDEGKVDLEL